MDAAREIGAPCAQHREEHADHDPDGERSASASERGGDHRHPEQRE
jgi:hypothetical protein